MAKFKVGDRVRVLDSSVLHANSRGIITKIRGVNISAKWNWTENVVYLWGMEEEIFYTHELELDDDDDAVDYVAVKGPEPWTGYGVAQAIS